MSDPRRVLVLAFVLVAAAAGCGGGGASTTTTTATGSPAVSYEPAPADFPLLGAWTTTITREDLEAGGITDPGLLNENSGRFTWAFEADGTWRTVQQSLDDAPVMNPAFEGYYTVADGVIEATTTFPEQYADDGLHYAFTLDGDAVTFDLLDPPDPILPLVIETHPWTRTSP